MLEPRRRAIHQQVAEAIQVLYQDDLDEYYEKLAYHYDRGGNVELAVAYLLKAGEKAKRSYANEAAIAHLSRGLELLKTVPEMPERIRQELDLLVALGVPLIHTRGHAAPEVEATYRQPRALCEHTDADDTPQLFQILVGLRRYYFMRVELQTGCELGKRFLDLAQNLTPPPQGAPMFRVGSRGRVGNNASDRTGSAVCKTHDRMEDSNPGSRVRRVRAAFCPQGSLPYAAV